MNFNDEFLGVLKNFAQINSNLMVNAGSTDVTTINESKSVYGCYTHGFEFDNDFAIYDLSNFISALNMFENKTVTIGDKFMTVQDDSSKSRLRYTFANPDLITKAPAPVKIDEFVSTFDLTNEMMNKLRKAQSVLDLSTVRVLPNGSDSVEIRVEDPNDPSNNQFALEASAENTSENFDAYLSMNNLLVLSGDYKVGISDKNLMKFTHDDVSLFYYISLERQSSIGE